MDNSIEFYKDSSEQLIALLIKNAHSGQGIDFLIDDSSYQQVAHIW